MKKGILLVNLGTPQSSKVAHVRQYLRTFLMDKRVIDISFLKRWLLVNIIIATFRAPKSAKEYKKLETEEGMPITFMGERVQKKLTQRLGKDYCVALAMRYLQPTIADALSQLKNCKEITIIPLFPQYAAATTGSVHEMVMQTVQKWQVIPNISFISKFFQEELYLQNIVQNATHLMQKKTYEHYIFSYHGLPERQIIKASVKGFCKLSKCCDHYHNQNTYCYRAQCFENSRLLAQKLQIEEGNYSVCFQSRLGKTPWIKPYLEDEVEKLTEKGIKKVLIFSPSFVADCLETTLELGETYKELFCEKGGREWDLVPSLNDNEMWISCLEKLAKS